MIETINLSKKYGSFLALDKLNLKVNAGEIYCLLGANGAGKSTSIGLLLNSIQPTEGTATIDGLDVVAHPTETKKLISYIPENLMLYPKLSGLENLEFFCRLSGKKLALSTLKNLMIESGIQADFIDKKVSTYSKGMRQKVGIALTIAKDAKVLLLDEPTSGLDPKASNDFAELLRKMSDKKVAVLMATHDLFRARETATTIGIMNHGKLIDSLKANSISNTDLEKLYLQHMNS